jgi:FkbM family methyltransferase
MSIFYKIVYQPTINAILRSIVTVTNSFIPKKIIMPLTGIITFKINESNDIVLELNESSPFCVVYWNDPAKFEFTPVFTKLIKQCNSFLDIGANLGFYSFVAAKSNPNIIVHSFEPSNGAHYYISRNVAHNKANNVTVHKTALSDKNGAISFHEEINPKYPYLKHFLSGISNTDNTHSMRASKSYDVTTETLDHFVQRIDLSSVDLIKMDTEGTEHLIVSQGLNTLQKFKPILIIEILDDSAAQSLERLILPLDYKMFQYTDKGLLPLDKITFGDNEKDRNFFFVPLSKLDLISPFIIK